MKAWRHTDETVDACPYGFGDTEFGIVFKAVEEHVVASMNHSTKHVYCTECGNSFYRSEPLPDRGLYSQELKGKFTQARACPGSAPARYCEIYNHARVPSTYAKASIEAARIAMRKDQEAAVRFIDTIFSKIDMFQKDTGERAPHGLTMVGPAGVGKSHLCACVVRYLSFRYGLRCTWVSMVNLSMRVRSRWDNRSMPQFDRSQSEIDIMDQVALAKVLILDDVGRGSRGGHESKLLEEIIARRENHIALQTWVTSNLSPTELQDWLGTRSYSRLMKIAPLVVMGGFDLRSGGVR